MSEAVLRLDRVSRRFLQGDAELEILSGVDLELRPGTLAALVGPSGAGKSTLLHIAGLLERPTGGEVIVDGRSAGTLADSERTRLRRERIGFVYQAHHLLPDFSAVENVMLPLLIGGVGKRSARERASVQLDRLGLGDRLSHRPAKLSGGEQQRVAIARALANRPGLILADEPTGNLDLRTADEVFELLLALSRDAGTAALIATHNADLAARMDVTFRLQGGLLRREPRRSLSEVAAPA